jgi:SAM-dependent methyltransferase
MDLLRKIRRRAYTAYYERRLGITTDAAIPVDKLDYKHADTKPYHPLSYESILWALQRIPYGEEQVEFVDIGCGMGRAICTAATRPFRSVTGVELSPSLSEVSRQNLAKLKGRRAKTVNVHEGDATAFPISPTANVFYLFNPFGGDTLRTVIGNIGRSLEAHPRPATIIFFNHRHADPLLTSQSWLQKTFDGEFYPQVTCGLYQTR